MSLCYELDLWNLIEKKRSICKGETNNVEVVSLSVIVVLPGVVGSNEQ